MTQLITALVATAALSGLCVLGLIPLARRFDLLDAPGGRKQHHKPVPQIGGLAMLGGVLAGVAIFGELGGPHLPLLVGMVALAMLGLVDDAWNLGALLKAMCQLLVAAMVVLWGALEVTSLGNLLGFGGIGLGGFSVVFTVLCITLLINAVNMLDGVDGLAGGVVFVALAWFAGAVLLAGQANGSMVLFILLGALLGFLVFNIRSLWRHRAAVFMGDAGSMMLGLALGWFAIRTGQGPDAVVPPVVVAWVLTVPVFDLLTVMLIRLREKRSPLSADRNHIHHLLLDCGLGMTWTVWLLVGVALLAGAIGFVGWRSGVPEPVLFYPWLALFVVHLGFVWRSRAARATRTTRA